jgi:hypothetical protein
MKKSKHPLGSFENPVRCKDVSGEREYLDRLFGPGGLTIEYKRVRSKMGFDGDILDMYEVSYEGLTEPIIIFFNMYAKGPAEKKAVEGLHMIDEFRKPQSWQTLHYCQEVIKKHLPDYTDMATPEFYYLHTKAGYLLSQGPYIYARFDFFNMPYCDWDLNTIKNCAEQLVHSAKGLLPSYPLFVNSIETAQNFMSTFHFESDTSDIKTSDSGLFSIKATHMMDDRKIELYFKLT